jgi:hypothetical protein
MTSPASPSALTPQPHTHFCSWCYTKRGKANRKGDRGWWRCRDRKCVRLNAAYCPEHQERSDRMNSLSEDR